MSQPLHVVVGAAGATGRRLVRRLADAGHRVRAVSRNGADLGVPGVEMRAADARDAASVRRLVEPDSVVYHCAMPPITRWATEFPPLTSALLEAASATGSRLVYADSTWMYGRMTGPMDDQTPVRPVSQKGILRAFMAEQILHAAAAGRVRASLVRAGELYGPRTRSMIAGNVFAAVARDRAATWYGDADQPITPTFIDDFARTIAAVGTGDESAAAVWLVPHPEPTTGRRLVAEAARQAGTRPRLREVRSGLLRALGTLVPLAREATELVYQFEQPFVLDGRRTAAAFDLTPTPYADGIAACLAAIGTPHPVGTGAGAAR
jgi:nucleoside-diphosphate-sugar epimerase